MFEKPGCDYRTFKAMVPTGEVTYRDWERVEKHRFVAAPSCGKPSIVSRPKPGGGTEHRCARHLRS